MREPRTGDPQLQKWFVEMIPIRCLCKEKPHGYSGLHWLLQPSDLHHIYLPARHSRRDYVGLFLQKYSGCTI